MRILLLCLLVAITGCTRLATVWVLVEVPDSTTHVTIAGNLNELGNWDPAAVPMDSLGSGQYGIKFQVRVGDTVEYKFTRGSWMTEALDGVMGIPPNYRQIVTGDTTIYHQVFAWRDSHPTPGAGITGVVRYHRNFYSPQLDNYRDLIVWLPPSYSTDSLARYPVLYMHDGQNIIDPFTSFAGQDWRIDEVATELIESGAISEIIIIGINNTDNRTAEYSPVHLGGRYSEFLINTVKPFIDTNYRTQPGPEYTAVMGSSMGGLISLHLAWEYPNVFSMAGCLSPAFMVDSSEIVSRVRQSLVPVKPIKLYIDSGTLGLEVRLQPAIDQIIPLLANRGFQEGDNLVYLIAEGAMHNEQAWAQRINVPLKFFYGKGN